MVSRVSFASKLLLTCTPVVAQMGPSVPMSEAVIEAGSTFSVEVYLPVAYTPIYQMRVSADFVLESSSNVTDAQARFTCQSDALQMKTSYPQVTLVCTTSREQKGGVYKHEGPVTFRREMLGDQQGYDLRLPIITIKALPPPAPPAPTNFPTGLVSARLKLSNQEAFADGGAKAQDLLSSFAAAIPTKAPSSKANKAYLVAVAKQARNIVELTKQRYQPYDAYKRNQKEDPSVIFEDFISRLEQVVVTTESNKSMVSQDDERPSRFVLVQLPSRSDSVDIRSASGNLNASYYLLANILTDLAAGFQKIGQSGIESFTWSLSTLPSGAEVYYSRLGKAEDKWAGLTDISQGRLPYAMWTFRISWNGCSRKESPNPYRQDSIKMVVPRTGCSTQ